MHPEEVIAAVRERWNYYSSDTENWSVDAPAEGQDAVSALAINRIMGGVILRADYVTGDRKIFHHYNMVPGENGVPTIVDATRDFMEDDSWLHNEFSHYPPAIEPGWIMDAVPGRDIRFNYYLDAVLNELDLYNDTDR